MGCPRGVRISHGCAGGLAEYFLGQIIMCRQPSEELGVRHCRRWSCDVVPCVPDRLTAKVQSSGTEADGVGTEHTQRTQRSLHDIEHRGSIGQRTMTSQCSCEPSRKETKRGARHCAGKVSETYNRGSQAVETHVTNQELLCRQILPATLWRSSATVDNRKMTYCSCSTALLVSLSVSTSILSRQRLPKAPVESKRVKVVSGIREGCKRSRFQPRQGRTSHKCSSRGLLWS